MNVASSSDLHVYEISESVNKRTQSWREIKDIFWVGSVLRTVEDSRNLISSHGLWQQLSVDSVTKPSVTRV